MGKWVPVRVEMVLVIGLEPSSAYNRQRRLYTPQGAEMVKGTILGQVARGKNVGTDLRSPQMCKALYKNWCYHIIGFLGQIRQSISFSCVLELVSMFRLACSSHRHPIVTSQ